MFSTLTKLIVLWPSIHVCGMHCKSIQYMVLHTYYIESSPIKEVTSAKYLGVTIDDFALLIFQVALVLLAC